VSVDEIEKMESYADRIRRQEHEIRCKRGRFSRRELARMHEEARGLLHLAATGWLPERTEPVTRRANRSQTP
jgi:hypothetical protein